MKTTSLLAKHIREIYTGGNWTYSNLADAVKDLDYQDAQKSIYNSNSIAVLLNHLHYYIPRVITVLQGGAMEGNDKMSWATPEFASQKDWDDWIAKIMEEAEEFASLVEALPDSILTNTFVQEKYGTYFRNINGIIEHNHYHLGQIVLIRKIIAARK